MNETRARGGGRIARAGLAALAAAAALWALFKAFEPDITGSEGSKPLPEEPYPLASHAAEGWTEAGARADAWLEGARRALDAPALSAAVSVDGEIVWAGVTGYADLDAQVPATPETVFRLGGSSKAVTAMAMGTLLARGSVDLDAPVSTYLPDLAEPLARTTTRQLMSHTAGVRHYGMCLCFPVTEYYSRKHYETQREALRPFERSRLLFPPGEGFSFSSYGYTVVGAVIEAVTQERFADVLEEALFSPLGLAASRADAGRPEEGDARFYIVASGRYLEAFRVDNTNRLASGGLLSTPSDMARLGYQMIEPTLFDEATRDLLIRPQTLADGGANPEGYALGWRVDRARTLGAEIVTPRLHHDGYAVGAMSSFAVYPEYGMVAAVMTNRAGLGREPLLEPHADALAEIFAAEAGKRGGGAARR